MLWKLVSRPVVTGSPEATVEEAAPGHAHDNDILMPLTSGLGHIASALLHELRRPKP